MHKLHKLEGIQQEEQQVDFRGPVLADGTAPRYEKGRAMTYLNIHLL